MSLAWRVAAVETTLVSEVNDSIGVLGELLVCRQWSQLSLATMDFAVRTAWCSLSTAAVELLTDLLSLSLRDAVSMALRQGLRPKALYLVINEHGADQSKEGAAVASRLSVETAVVRGAAAHGQRGDEAHRVPAQRAARPGARGALGARSAALRQGAAGSAGTERAHPQTARSAAQTRRLRAQPEPEPQPQLRARREPKGSLTVPMMTGSILSLMQRKRFFRRGLTLSTTNRW